MAVALGTLVAIDVKPGGKSDSQSGLNLLFPRVYGRLAAKGCNKDLAFIVMHPSSNFHGHYLLGPLEARGYATLALNSRFVANDATLLMERCIQDLGAGVKFLREAGYQRIILIGNSGGGSLAAFYQAEAEQLTITHTPDGRPINITPDDLPPVDAIALLAAHPGRAITLTDWLDPSVIDENDPALTDPELDMFSPANGPPYSQAWLDKYRRAQIARNDRITDRALALIRALEQNPDPESPKDAVFLVHRTSADPRFVDLTIDPSDRKGGTTRGSARETNFSAMGLARVCTARSWLSQWSLRLSKADGPRCLARTSVPVLSVIYSADPVIMPQQSALWRKAAGNRCEEYVLKGGTHHLQGQQHLIEELADVLASWSHKTISAMG